MLCVRCDRYEADENSPIRLDLSEVYLCPRCKAEVESFIFCGNEQYENDDEIMDKIVDKMEKTK